MNDEMKAYTQLLEEYFKQQGLHRMVSYVTEASSEVLSDSRGSVSLITIKYADPEQRINTKRFISRGYTAQKYDNYDDAKIRSEVSTFRVLSDAFRKMGFNALPAVYHSTGEGRNTVFYMQYVGDYTLAELYPVMSPAEWALEEILAHNGPVVESSIDQNVLLTLEANNRVERIRNQERMGTYIAVKEKFARRAAERKKQGMGIAPTELELRKDLRAAFGLVTEFQRRLLLWKEQGMYDCSQVLVQNETYLRDEFEIALSRLAEAPAEIKARLSVLYSHLFVKRILSTTPMLIHGDCCAHNIVKGPEGYNEFFIIDTGRIAEGCPLIDAADFISYCRFFCGMQTDQENEFWEQELHTTGVSDKEMRHIVSVSREIRIAGALKNRIKIAESTPNTFLALKLKGMRRRLPAYENSLRQFFGAGWQTLESVDKILMQEFSELMLKHYLRQA
jgi:hypothetical protein